MASRQGTTGSGVIDEMIRQRAYEISQGPDAGTPDENWERARSELYAELEREAHDAALEPND
jgi:Protein of unknown function (DUF2934)